MTDSGTESAIDKMTDLKSKSVIYLSFAVYIAV